MPSINFDNDESMKKDPNLLLMERRIGGLDVDFLLAHWASMLLRREDRNVCELIDGPRRMCVIAGAQ